jgi:hypothetical protein
VPAYAPGGDGALGCETVTAGAVLALLLELAGPDAGYVRVRAVVLAPAIVAACGVDGACARRLAAVSWAEAAYRTGVVGVRGELGPWQVAPTGWARDYCPGWDLRVVRVNARCAARLLREGERRCGTPEGALTFYGVGSGCTSAYARKVLAVLDRLKDG